MPVLVLVRHRQPAAEQELRRRRRPRPRRRVQRRVAVGVEGPEVGLVGGQELEAAQEALPVAGDVERRLPELVPPVYIGAPLLEKLPGLSFRSGVQVPARS